MQLRSKLLATIAIPTAALVFMLMILWKRKRESAKPETSTSDYSTAIQETFSDTENEEKYEGEERDNDENDGDDRGDVNDADGSLQGFDNSEVSEVANEVEDEVCEGKGLSTESQSKPSAECSTLVHTDSQSTQTDSGIESKYSSTDLNGSSLGDDSQSDGSADSAAISSLTDAQPEITRDSKSTGSEKEIWEVEFPQILCGRLIGRKGKNVKVISEQSGAKIRLIPQSPGEVSTHRIISITGESAQIGAALSAINEKFPTVTLNRINLTTQTPLTSTSVQLVAVTPSTSLPYVQTVLPIMTSVSVVVTSVIDARHFFVQLHNDIVQRQLQQLHQNMLQFYGQGAGHLIPPLPQPIMVGAYCASPAYTYNGWYRSQVLGPTANTDEVEVKYLDYGGYGRIAASSLRQLRSDFLNCLPFQAVECYLANVAPVQGDSFSSLASAVLEDLTMNAVLTARVVGHQNQLPCLELYIVQGDQTILVNRELVNKGLAIWVES